MIGQEDVSFRMIHRDVIQKRADNRDPNFLRKYKKLISEDTKVLGPTTIKEIKIKKFNHFIMGNVGGHKKLSHTLDGVCLWDVGKETHNIKRMEARARRDIMVLDHVH